MGYENEYIQYCVDLINEYQDFNQKYTINGKYILDPKIVKRSHWLRRNDNNGEFNEVLQPILDKKEKALDFINGRHSLNSNYLYLWEYSEFIRWCEKMLLYNNDQANIIYSDASIDSIDDQTNLDDRTITFNIPKYNIIASLKLSKIADFDSTTDSLKFRKTTKIVVDRKYGRGIVSKFILIDDKPKFNNDSDKMLFDIVLEVINSNIRNHYTEMIHKIINGDFMGCKLQRIVTID